MCIRDRVVRVAADHAVDAEADLAEQVQVVAGEHVEGVEAEAVQQVDAAVVVEGQCVGVSQLGSCVGALVQVQVVLSRTSLQFGAPSVANTSARADVARCSVERWRAASVTASAVGVPPRGGAREKSPSSAPEFPVAGERSMFVGEAQLKVSGAGYSSAPIAID